MYSTCNVMLIAELCVEMFVLNINVTNVVVMVVVSEGLFYTDENQLALKGILQIVKKLSMHKRQ